MPNIRFINLLSHIYFVMILYELNKKLKENFLLFSFSIKSLIIDISPENPFCDNFAIKSNFFPYFIDCQYYEMLFYTTYCLHAKEAMIDINMNLSCVYLWKQTNIFVVNQETQILIDWLSVRHWYPDFLLFKLWWLSGNLLPSLGLLISPSLVLTFSWSHHLTVFTPILAISFPTLLLTRNFGDSLLCV